MSPTLTVSGGFFQSVRQHTVAKCVGRYIMLGNARSGVRCVASKSERDNPAVAGFRQSCRNRAYSRPACGQPKPKSLHSRVFSFLATTPQGGIAIWAMSGPHPCTDGASVMTPAPLAFRRDQGNRQRRPTTATDPRNGCLIDRIRRYASSRPFCEFKGWLREVQKTGSKAGQSGALGVILWSKEKKNA